MPQDISINYMCVVKCLTVCVSDYTGHVIIITNDYVTWLLSYSVVIATCHSTVPVSASFLV